MKRYLASWSITRVIRLVFGGMIIFEGIRQAQWVLAAMGGVITLITLLTAGCCGSGSCSVNRGKC
ncbi:hypothetical protein DVR12_19770 [Chitinophaga silvatica]|uniref:DUF2892 domain-containing protein n=1 Tax=Chitinophaga silvatica TaxID=2282649 RepID=A0A3E1Y5F2_9BACT|nr:hypothetical protein [Chitinophaga silvatica]RFS19968.1 hypothetical protein DVR12_19770 [Chitinophaga silvatica]